LQQSSNSPSRNPSVRPPGSPSFIPTRTTTGKPTRLPSTSPFRDTSVVPSIAPSSELSIQPSVDQLLKPSVFVSWYTISPSVMPTKSSTENPSSKLSVVPSFDTSPEPSLQLSGDPLLQPLIISTLNPTNIRSARPSTIPTLRRTITSTINPTGPEKLSESPSFIPTRKVSEKPLYPLSIEPSIHKTVSASESPSNRINNFINALGVEQSSDPSDPVSLALEWASSQSFAPSMQRFALATLYFATRGERWTNQYNFLSETNECLWFEQKEGQIDRKGVTCGNDGTVTGLSFVGNNLSGILPAELAYLVDLELIDVSNNRLRGAIPPSFDAISQLNTFIIKNNWMGGSVPTELGNLSNLQMFELQGNFFVGSLEPVCNSRQKGAIFNSDCEEVFCPCCHMCCGAMVNAI